MEREYPMSTGDFTLQMLQDFLDYLEERSRRPLLPSPLPPDFGEFLEAIGQKWPKDRED
jgi:hypothetical protein